MSRNTSKRFTRPQTTKTRIIYKRSAFNRNLQININATTVEIQWLNNVETNI